MKFELDRQGFEDATRAVQIASESLTKKAQKNPGDIGQEMAAVQAASNDLGDFYSAVRDEAERLDKDFDRAKENNESRKVPALGDTLSVSIRARNFFEGACVETFSDLYERLRGIDEEEYFPFIYEGYLRLLGVQMDVHEEGLKKGETYAKITEFRDELNDDTKVGGSFIQKAVKGWRKHSVKEKHRIRGDFQVSMAARVVKDVWNEDIIQASFGSNESLSYKAPGGSLIYQLREDGSIERYGPYVSALRMMSGARRFVREALRGKIENYLHLGSYSFSLGALRDLLEKVEPIFYAAEQMRVKIGALEENLFGSDSKLAGQLWRELVFLKTKKIHSAGVIETQKELLGLLHEKKYQEAIAFLYVLEGKNPGLLGKISKYYLFSLIDDNERAELDSRVSGKEKESLWQQRKEEKERTLEEVQKRKEAFLRKYNGTLWESEDGSLRVELGSGNTRHLHIRVLCALSNKAIKPLVDYFGNKGEYNSSMGYRFFEEDLQFFHELGLHSVGASSVENQVFNDWSKCYRLDQDEFHALKERVDAEKLAIGKRYRDTTWKIKGMDLLVRFSRSVPTGVYCNVIVRGSEIWKEKTKYASPYNAPDALTMTSDALMDNIYVKGAGKSRGLFVYAENIENMLQAFNFEKVETPS